jgi:hypothetical protein
VNKRNSVTILRTNAHSLVAFVVTLVDCEDCKSLLTHLDLVPRPKPSVALWTQFVPI